MADIEQGKLVLIIFAILTTVEASGNDGCFYFPTLPSNLTVTSKENSLVTIPFKLKHNPACFPDDQSNPIYISHPNNPVQEFCVLKVEKDEVCRVLHNEENCQCPAKDDGSFIFTKTVNRDDAGAWTWKSGDVTSLWTKVNLEVQEPNESPGPSTRTVKVVEIRKTYPVSNSGSTLRTLIPGIIGVVTTASNNVVLVPDSEGGIPGGMAMFAGIFVGANVLTVIAVATIVYVLRGRRERRKRDPLSGLPPTPKKNVRGLENRRAAQANRDVAANSYIELPSRPESRKYEQIPTDFRASANHGYEVPIFIDRQ